MNLEIAHRLFLFVAAAFGVGSAWLLLAALTGRIPARRGLLLLGTEVAIVGFILGPAFLGAGALTLAVALVGGAATWEMYGVLEKGGHAPLRWTGTVAVGLVVSVAYERGLDASLAVAVLGGLLMLAGSLAAPVADGETIKVGSTLIVLLYPGLCLAHLVALGARADGFGLVVFAYAVVELSDSIAYLAGRTLGHRRVFPELSPNKTWVGSAAGLLGALALAPALAFAVPRLSLPTVVGGALVLAVGGQVGDLVASRFKREAGLKDYGGAIPGHGGVFDVYDSLIFAVPFFFYYQRLLAP